MEFGLFKGLLGLLFFGSAFAVGFLQLTAVKQSRLRERVTSGDLQKPLIKSNDGG